MADYVYVGRSRHRGRVALYQVLTLGVYGRVWLYKLLRDFDGHGALFLDRRPYIPLLILPIIGPFLVKRRVTLLAEEMVEHEVTGPRFRRRDALLLALIPLAPFFHVYVQKVVNHHWRMHTKQEELELKQQQLVQLQRRKSAAVQEQTRVLAAEVAQRQKELEDLRSAALALREAESLRRRAEREGGVRKSPLASVRKLAAINPLRRKGPTPEGTPPNEPVDRLEEPEPAPATSKGEVGRKKTKPSAADVEEPATESEEQPAAPRRGLLSRFLPRRAESGEAESTEPKTDTRLSRKERRALRQQAKQERKAVKLAAKEEKRKAKELRKTEQQAAKEARRAEKQREKEERAKAKEETKPSAPKEKRGGKAKAGGKKEKPAGAPPKAKKKAK